MKKSTRKIASLLLALVMLFGLSVSALATATDTADTTNTVALTIDAPLAGHTYTIYQMLKGDVSELSKGSGVLANVKAGENLNDTVEKFDDAISITDAEGNKTYLTGTDLAAAASAKVTGEAYGTIVKGETDAADTVYTKYVEPGYYVVKDTYSDSGKECTAYMVAVVGDTTLSPKTSTPPLDKVITDDDANKALDTGRKTDTAAIGDVINFQVTSEVPVTTGYKYYYYVVTDTMSEGLTLNKDSFSVQINGTELPEADYTLSPNGAEDEGNDGFELVIKDMRKYTAGDAIVITYTATVNENAKIGVEPNTNTVKLTYSNNPQDTYKKDKNPDDKPGKDDVVGVTPEYTTKTYVTQLSIIKTDADQDIFVDALKGATFTLTGNGMNDVKVLTETVFVEDNTDGEYYKLKDGTYTKTEANELTTDKYESTTTKYKTVTTVSLTNADSGADVNITAVVDEAGKITFTGLNAGKYKLVETNVPTGYNKCADIEFTISADLVDDENIDEAKVGYKIDWKSSNEDVEEVLDDDDNALGVFEANIENQKGNTLPSTGGIGTTIFYVLGIILVLGAGVVLVTRKRAVK